MPSQEIFDNIKEITQMEKLGKFLIMTNSLDYITKEIWDLIINRPYKVTIDFGEHEMIQIKKKGFSSTLKDQTF